MNKVIKEELNKKIELGNSIYEKVHNLYFYGDNVEFVQDKNHIRSYIEIDNQKYYEIKNYEVVEKIIGKEQILRTNKYLNIKKINNKYYMKDVGRGLLDYYGMTLEIKKISKNRIEYEAKTKLCKIENIVLYGEGCTSNGYYYIEKPFVLVKEEGTWKVEEYTSIFEFKDSEIK